MEKKQKRGNKDLTSLIPTVKNEEKLLQELLQEEREKAEAAIARAQAEAEELVKRAAEELPRLLECERAARGEALREQAEKAHAAARVETDALERAARERVARAVSFVVSKVWPEGAP